MNIGLPSIVATSFFTGIFTFLLPEKRKINTKVYFLIFILIGFQFFNLSKDFFSLGSLVYRLSFFSSKELILIVNQLSYPFLLLNFGLLFLCTLYLIKDDRKNKLMGLTFILASILFCFFAAADLITFYVSFEAILIPMFFMMILYGAEKKEEASFKFFLYTFIGSIFLLFGLLWLAISSGMSVNSFTYPIADLISKNLSINEQLIITFCLIIGFLIKLPLFPFHSWLPHAHTQAPTVGSVFLAAIMLKVGGVGIYQIILPILPVAFYLIAPYLGVLSVFSIIYIGILTLVQNDMKKLIAYSSIAHMGFVGLGYMTLICAIKENNINQIELSFDGLYFQMISHGLISAGLFFSVGMLYERIHSRDLSNYGGLAGLMPRLGLFFTFFALANAALPGTSGFVGEFLILLSTYSEYSIYAIIGSLSLITGASYNLYLIKRIFYGPVRNKDGVNFVDLTIVESLILGTLALGIIFLGVYPNFLTSFLPKDSVIALHQAFIS